MSEHAAIPPRHTVVVRLHDRPGALYRAIGLIRRRGYNVASLVVGASERPGTSRMRTPRSTKAPRASSSGYSNHTS